MNACAGQAGSCFAKAALKQIAYFHPSTTSSYVYVRRPSGQLLGKGRGGVRFPIAVSSFAFIHHEERPKIAVLHMRLHH